MAAFMHLRETKVYKIRRSISPVRCKQLLRFQDESVNFITDYFLDDHFDNRGGALSNRMKMEIFLRYISDPGFQSGVAVDIGVHRTTVCKTFSEVLDKITEKSHHWIKFPSTAVDLNDAREEWSARFRIPTAIGALDCTHIEIKTPNNFKDEYVNRKGKITINVQGTCDAAEKFTSIDAQWPGSVQDSRIWRQSIIQETLRQYDGTYCLIGDSGYGISPWLMTPFKPPQNDLERHYNLIHAQDRVIIERVFGQLKQRFPILKNKVRVSLDKVPKIVVCCAVLHNISKHLNDGWDYDFEENNELLIEDNANGHVLDRNELRIRQRGQQKRDNIARILQPM